MHVEINQENITDKKVIKLIKDKVILLDAEFMSAEEIQVIHDAGVDEYEDANDGTSYLSDWL